MMQRWKPKQELTRWHPLSEADNLGRFFDQTVGRPLYSVFSRLPLPLERNWMPPIDMIEEDDRFSVKAELPGIKKEDIEISASEDSITIKGQKNISSEVKEDSYHCRECMYGKFYRYIPFPDTLDTENITADYENGVLEVTIPKSPETNGRKVPVSFRK
ncbi:MAG: Hsp20/alpha crystallin family protein [Dehalococcoidales bacterium]